MPEPVTLYRAADGTLFDTEQEADLHDMQNALSRHAELFAEKHIGKQRTISKYKATQLLVAFSMQMLSGGLDLDEAEDEDNNDEQQSGTSIRQEGSDET